MSAESQPADPAAENPGQTQEAEAKATTFIEEASAAKEAPATTNPLPGWTSATSKEVRSDPRFTAYAAKFQKFDDVVKSAIELESKLGGMVSIPGEKATPEEVAAFYERLGVPKEHKAYNLELDKELVYDEAELEAFKQFAHELHLTDAQAKAFMQKSAATAKKLLSDAQAKAEADKKAATEKEAAEFQAVEADLKKTWGAKYQENYEVAKRGLTAYAEPGLLEALSKAGLGNSPAVIQHFYRLGTMTREDSVATTKSGSAGEPKTAAELLYGKKEG